MVNVFAILVSLEMTVLLLLNVSTIALDTVNVALATSVFV